jgi:hypothetical protein
MTLLERTTQFLVVFFFGSETIHLLQGLIDMEWFQIPVNGYKLGFRS